MFILTLVVGAATVVAIALSPLYANRMRIRRSAPLGTLLVAASLGLGAWSFAISGRGMPPKDALFLCLFAALLLGTLLLLAADPDDRGDDEDGPADHDGDPPWWPEFEAGFRDYSRQHRSRVVTR